MRYEFSTLVEKYKTQKTFDKWVDERKAEIKDLAYENRGVIDKKSVERQQELFDSVKKAYKPLKSLRKKSEFYDALFIIDKEGYVDFWVYFPIKGEELDKALEYKKKRIEELGAMGKFCISTDEAVYDVLHEKVYKTFSFARPITACKHFSKHEYGLVREMEVFGFQ